MQISFLMTANGSERRVVHGFRLGEAHRDFLCDASEDFSSKSGISVATLVG